jgi:hypothetical protein
LQSVVAWFFFARWRDLIGSRTKICKNIIKSDLLITPSLECNSWGDKSEKK